MFLAAWGRGWIGKVSCGCDRSMRWLVVGANETSKVARRVSCGRPEPWHATPETATNRCKFPILRGQGLDRLWSAWDAPGNGCRLAARPETRGRALLAAACEGRFVAGLIARIVFQDGGALWPEVGRRCGGVVAKFE